MPIDQRDSLCIYLPSGGTFQCAISGDSAAWLTLDSSGLLFGWLGCLWRKTHFMPGSNNAVTRHLQHTYSALTALQGIANSETLLAMHWTLTFLGDQVHMLSRNAGW